MRTLVCFVFVNVYALSALNARRGYIGVEKLVLIYFQRIYRINHSVNPETFREKVVLIYKKKNTEDLS